MRAPLAFALLAIVAAGCAEPRAATVASTTPAPPATGELVLTMVDVGQGMAILIQFPDAVAVVDAANRFTASTNALLEALASRGIATIDHLAITNPDADHAGACDDLARQVQVRHFYHPGNPKETATWADCLAAMGQEGAVVHRDAVAAEEGGADLDEGALLPWSAHATVQLLNADSESGEINQGSLAFLIRFGGTAILLAGDMDCETEAAVLARGYALDIDVLQAGHHGSRSSTCGPWLAATTPHDVLVPVGLDNSYGHPHPEVVARIEGAGATLYRTDLHGDVTVRVTPQGYQVATERVPPA